MQNTRVTLAKCRIIFLDLEFYVPDGSRSKLGFCYNPWDKNCKLLGGAFLSANPEKDFGRPELDIRKKIESRWLWDCSNEKELLQSIYDLLRKDFESVRKAHNNSISPILCGIGITSSDIPILFELFKRFNILDNREAFKFQNGFRGLDLSQLALATFNNSGNFLYPKSKSHILHKYLPDKTFDSGKSVWQLYETGDYAGIQSRVFDEIVCTHRCYELIKADLDRFKTLEKNYKTSEKNTRKNQAE